MYQTDRENKPRKISGLKVLSEAMKLRRDQIAWIRENQRDFQPCELQFGKKVSFVTSNPDHAQHVLQKQNWNYRKSENYDGLRETLGNGLLTSEGNFWRRQRKLAQPLFQNKMLKNFVSVMAEVTEQTLDQWTPAPRDVHEEMMSLTMQIIARTMFSTSVADDTKELSQAVTALTRFAHRRVLLEPPSWIPTKRSIEGKNGIRYLDNLLYRVIDERRDNGQAPKDDFLGMFMAATGDAHSDRMNNKQLRDEMITIFAAGHETTAVALTWLWKVLQRHPEIEEKMVREANVALADGITLDSIGELHYTERVIREVLRMYSPVWVVERQAISEDVVGDMVIPAGATVALPIFMLHRHPDHWTEPEVFSPDRFLPEAVEKRHRFAYLPFGAGPRICIGASFALMEAKLIAAMTVQKFSLRGLDRGLEWKAGVTLRPVGDLRMRALPRQ